MVSRRTLTVEMLVRALAMKYEGKTYSEIASTLGCSKATIARWIPRVEAILHKYLPTVKLEGGGVKQEDPLTKIQEGIEKIQKDLDEIKKIIRESQ